jgi:hypothetical protein
MPNQETKPIVLKNDLEMPAEVLASEIEKVAKAAQQLLSSRLSRKALLVLLQHSTGLTQHDVGLVLDHAANLHSYLKR